MNTGIGEPLPDRAGGGHVLVATNTGWAMFRFRGWLIERLIAHGWRVTAVADYRDGYREEVARLGADTVDVPVEGSGTGPLRDLVFFSRLWRLYRRLRPDIVQHYTIKPVIYGSIAARLTGVPKIIDTVTGLGIAFGGERPLLALIVRLLYRTALGGRCMVLFQNADDRQRFLDAGLVRDAASGVLSGSGVETSALLPDDSLPFTERTEIVMASRMLASKGTREFIAAARSLSPRYPWARFVMIGGVREDHGSRNPDFVPRAELEAATGEGVVTWLGRQPPETVENRYRRCLAAVLPSYYPEGVPRSLIEAASAGAPVVTTDMPGCRDVVEDGRSGYLVAPRSADALAAALEHLLADRASAAAMGHRSRQIAVERFDTRRIFAAMLQAYEGKPPRP